MTLDEPRLLARASQYGYVTLDPQDPDAGMHRAMFSEPEPIRADELSDLQHRASIARQQRYAATKGSILAGLEQLADGATGYERRRLQNAQRAIKSL
jgi:hypothetical protein